MGRRGRARCRAEARCRVDAQAAELARVALYYTALTGIPVHTVAPSRADAERAYRAAEREVRRIRPDLPQG
jgi:hypothetical protein